MEYNSKCKLKKEAVPFFDEKLATSILPLETWQKYYHVDEKALEEVKPAYIERGHKFPDGNGCSLGGWSKDDGGRLEFTIVFPSMKMREHDEFSKGRVVRELMDILQRDVNNFYERYLDNGSGTK